MSAPLPLKLTSNQGALLAALDSLGGVAMTRTEWVDRAIRHYLLLWPDGSNPVEGPRRAQRSLIRLGLVETQVSGSKKPVRLTSLGLELTQGRCAAVVHPPRFGAKGTPPLAFSELLELGRL